MKKDIHPQFNEDATITCACGAVHKTGSTMAEIQVELCSQCHPFYTGKQKILDTARRVEKFETRATKKEEAVTGKKAKREKRTAQKIAKQKQADKEEN